MRTFTPLKTATIDINNHIQPPLISADSPADLVVQPIAHILRHVISPEATIDQAQTIINSTEHSDHLYIGSKGRLLGIVQNKSLLGRHVLMKAEKMGLSRADLVVSDLMRSIHDIPVLSHEAVNHSQVGDLQKTMELTHESIFAIVDHLGNLTGITTASHIQEALNTPIEVYPIVKSFKECFDVIYSNGDTI